MNDPLRHFTHPQADQGELFAYRPMFADDVWQTAQKLVARDGADAPIVAELREGDDLSFEADRSFWKEVRRACKHIVTGKPPLA